MSLKATAVVERIGDWQQTHSGGQFYTLDPRPGEIFIEDIAHALSHQCRFAGHTEVFYCVDEHQVRVAWYLEETLRPTLGDGALEVALWGLMHDAGEAYLVDLPRPLKRQPSMAPYREAEERLMRVIAQRFGLPPGFHDDPRVKHADQVLLATEARDLMKRPPNAWESMPAPLRDKIEPWTPKMAREMFMLSFKGLGGAYV